MLVSHAGAASPLDHEGATMSDIEKKPEQSAEPEKPTEQIDDLPNKEITEEDAEAVKGGLGTKFKYDSLKVN
jgi:hypothetical protein